MWGLRTRRGSRASIAAITLSLLLVGLGSGQTRGDPVVVEPGWTLIRTISFSNGRSARLNLADGLVYVGRRGSGGADGLYRIRPVAGPEWIVVGSNVAGVLVDHADGDVFFSEDYGGVIYRVGFGETTRSTWVSGLHTGDDDPIGMAIVPAGHTGTVVSPGEAIVVDRGNAGLDEVWRWSPDTAEGETVLHADDGTLFDACDVAVDLADVWVVDTAGVNPGVLYRVGAGGALTPFTTSEPIADPVGIVADLPAGDLLVLDGGGDRVVRVDTTTGTVSDVLTGLSLDSYDWSHLDLTPDGRQMLITEWQTGSIYRYVRCADVTGPDDDCNGNGVLDLCEIEQGLVPDCNGNGVPDACDLASGFSADCDGNGIPDECPACPLGVDVVFVMDTSDSMLSEGEALCTSIGQVLGGLADAGIQTWETLAEIPDGVEVPACHVFSCLLDDVVTLYGTAVPGAPPPGLETLGACPGGIEVGCEDWGLAVAILAARHPWQPDAVRLIVPLSDEGAWCGDPSTAIDTDSIDHAITVASAYGVICSPITGNGSSGSVIAQAQALAAGTGGEHFSSTVPVNDIAQAIRDLVLDACTSAVDCNGNGVPDPCDIAAGTSLDTDGDGVPDECEEGSCPADVAGNDDVVDVTDLLAILGGWGTADPFLDCAPPGGDGTVDVADLLRVLADWGPCPPP